MGKMKPFLSLVILLLGAFTVWQLVETSRLRIELAQTKEQAAVLADDYRSATNALVQTQEQLWIVKKEGEVFAQALLDYQKAHPPGLAISQ